MMAVTATALSAKKTDTVKPSEADCRKADYIFMEAIRQQALGNDDAYFSLVQRAHDLNPDDHAAAYYLGYDIMSIAGKDSTRFDYGYRLMKNYFDLNPSDYYSSYAYGAVNDHIGNINESLRVWLSLIHI